MTDGVLVVGLVLYSSLFIFSIIFLLLFLRLDKQPLRSPSFQKLFFVFLLPFVIFRIAWFGLEIQPSGYSEFIINRLTLCLWFTCFSIIVAFWAETIHKHFVTADDIFSVSIVKWFLVVANGILYIFEIIVVVVFVATSGGQKEGNPFYDASIIIISLFSLGIAICFLLYGIRQLQMIKKSGDESKESKIELFKIGLVTMLFTICFLSRVIMFLWRPASGEFLPEGVFYTFGYFIPELIPTTIQIFVIVTMRKKLTFDSKFINDLYRASEIGENQEDDSHMRASKDVELT